MDLIAFLSRGTALALWPMVALTAGAQFFNPAFPERPALGSGEIVNPCFFVGLQGQTSLMDRRGLQTFEPLHRVTFTNTIAEVGIPERELVVQGNGGTARAVGKAGRIEPDTVLGLGVSSTAQSIFAPVASGSMEGVEEYGAVASMEWLDTRFSTAAGGTALTSLPQRLKLNQNLTADFLLQTAHGAQNLSSHLAVRLEYRFPQFIGVLGIDTEGNTLVPFTGGWQTHTIEGRLGVGFVEGESQIRTWSNGVLEGLLDSDGLPEVIEFPIDLGLGGMGTPEFAPGRRVIVMSEVEGLAVEYLPIQFRLSFASAAEAYASQPTSTASVEARNTLAFPETGPVFDLPAGLTANAPSIGLVNNQFVPVPEPNEWVLLIAAGCLGWAGVANRQVRRPARRHTISQSPEPAAAKGVYHP